MIEDRGNAVGAMRSSTSCGMVMRSSASLASSPLSIVTAVQRRPDTFEPRSNVHAIPEYVTILDDNVADMNADAEFDALVLRYSCITLHHAALDLNRTACSVHGTCKLNQYAIAGPLDDTAAMICNFWL